MRTSRRARSFQAKASSWRRVEDGARERLDSCLKRIEDADRVAARLRDRGRNIHWAEALAMRNEKDAAWWKANAAHMEEVVSHSSMMRRKYEDAAQYPW